MSADLAVVLLGGPELAGPLAEPLARACGCEVIATTTSGHLDVAARLAGSGRLVVGLSARPWPEHAELHGRASAAVPAYTGVVSWHGLPALHDALASAVAPGAATGAHVLVTAPDPGPDALAGDVVFLREVAEAIAARTALRTRSVAWRGTTRTPTALSAVTTLVDAHGVTDIVECPVAPGTGVDRDVSRAAERAGVRLTCVDLGRVALVTLLAEVIATVAAHEAGGDAAGGSHTGGTT